MDRTLDRLVEFDEKSRSYPVRTLLAAKQPRAYTWRTVTTDQGSQGACVGHGVTQDAAARPVTVFGDPLRDPPDVAHLNGVARDVYYDAQRIDPWPGGEYAGASPTYPGTSVLAGVKIGQRRGWWTGYRWALGPGPEAAAHDVILTIGYLGPVILGTVWRAGMWRADRDGYLRATGADEGGQSCPSRRRHACGCRRTRGSSHPFGPRGAGLGLPASLPADGHARLAVVGEPVQVP